ncbi:MAG: ABC transporter ATP-binding protein [Dethiobacteria bacterium]|nr:ABC transporter ATP-binding protein [Bacillota bacterium]
MLKVEKINVFYGDVQAVFDVSLEVKEGEIVALVGANAAGKSTTLNAISGLLPIQSGKVTFLGEEITNLPPHKIVERQLVQIPEGRRLFSHLTVLENLELGAYTPIARKNVKENLEKVFELFPILNERQSQLAHSFSGGQQQMLAIGRALMSMPKLLILDEPSLGLAPKIVMQVFDIVSKIREQGTTVLLVEQNVKQSLQLADRAYVLENGRLVMEGSAAELIDNPHLKKAYLGI